MKTLCCRYKNSNACSSRFALALCAALVMAVAIGMAAPGTAQAAHTAVLTVTNSSDSGPGSLRAAITTANNYPETPFEIVFAPDLGGSTITLASTLPEIEHKLTIDGGGTIAISGNNAYQVMSVAAGAKLELDNLTIEHGYPGGVFVDNDAALTVANSTFSYNGPGYGGGIILLGKSVTVTNSTFLDNSSSYGGGAIDNPFGGTLTVRNSTFSGNTAVIGGGIRSSGPLTVTNSTFSGNTASSTGGGIYTIRGPATVTSSTFSDNHAFSEGGGIGCAGALTVRNSTFSGNTAIASKGGGIYNDDVRATLTVINSTFSGNATDIDNDIGGTATLEGTILAGSLSGGDCRGKVTDNGYNIAGDRSCRFTKTTSTSGYGGTLFSGGLADNGGPTETIALAPGASNPAIDTVPAHLCPSTDQRGYARRDDHEHFCDIGAYESGATGGELRIDSSAGTFALNAAAGFDGPIHPLTQDVTLQIGSYSIKIPAGSFEQDKNGEYTFVGTVGGVSLQVRIDPATDTLQAEGTDPELSGITTNPVTVTLSIGTAVSHTSVRQAAETIVLTVTNSNDSGLGSLRAAITTANNDPKTPYKIVFAPDLGGSTITLASTLPAIDDTLTIDGGGNITISGGHTGSTHGVMVMQVNSGATLELDNLMIGDGFGETGGISNDGTLTVNNSTFSDNRGVGAGAINNNYDATLTVTNSTFSNNTGSAGGGILSHGTLTVNNSTFSNNNGSAGGGIWNDSALTVNNSTFSGNSRSGIYNASGTVTVDNSTFSVNAAEYGGGIYNNGGTVSVGNSTFSRNSASNGGGIYNSGTLTVTNSTFAHDSSAINNDDGTATLEGTILAYSGGDDCAGKITDRGYNIDDDGSCGFTNRMSMSDYGGTLFSGGLADNGGPTETIALAPGASNPAIDAITAHLCPSTDQRGYARRDDHEHFCDIGAYESGATGGELRIDSSAGTFELNAAVGFDGPIHPLTQDVTLQIGSYSIKIPAGSFEQDKNGEYTFVGTVGGVSLQVRIDPATDTLQAKGSDAELSGITTNPVTVTLSIGTAVSHTSVTASGSGTVTR